MSKLRLGRAHRNAATTLDLDLPFRLLCSKPVLGGSSLASGFLRLSFCGSGFLLAVLMLALLAEPALAKCPDQDQDCLASEDVANSVVDELDNGRIHEMWDRHAGNYFRSQVTENVFLAASAGPVATLSIGVAARTIAQQGPAVDPASGKPYYGRLYKVTLKSGAVYFETVSLVKEDGAYKLSGLYLVPAPVK
jgi:hypothetical protein